MKLGFEYFACWSLVNMFPVVILILICIFLLKPSLQEALQTDLPIWSGSFLNLGQTVEKHEEVHILAVEDHQEEKQRAMRQKRVPEHIGCPAKNITKKVTKFVESIDLSLKLVTNLSPIRH